MKYAVLLVLLAVTPATCCAPNSIYVLDKQQRVIKQCNVPVLFMIAANTPVEHVETIRAGFNHWNESVGEKIFLEVGSNGWNINDPETKAFTIIGIAPSEGHMPRKRGESIPCGTTSYLQLQNGCAIGSVVSLNPRCVAHGPEILETIVRHEAGHVLSLDHSDLFTDLMYMAIEPTVQHPVDANESEIRAVRRLYLGETNDRPKGRHVQSCDVPTDAGCPVIPLRKAP